MQKMPIQTKVCTGCRRLLPLSAYHARRHYSRLGVRAQCVDCTSAAVRARRECGGGYVSDPRKELVRARTRRAIEAGILKREPCAHCRALEVEPHHARYDGACAHLEVVWLCKLHHAAVHGRRNWTRQLDLRLAS